MATILIVDDNQTNRQFLVTLLGYGGHRLLEASDGAEALELARDQRPDLAIVDLVMPTTDGYEFVRQLRADPKVAGTRVIFHSATYTPEEVSPLANVCGVSHILTKPADPEAILSSVQTALGLSGTPVLHPAAGDEFDREHLRLLTNKLAEKVADLERANASLTTLNEELCDTIFRLRETEKEVTFSREETILRLARAVECRDDETGQHVQRMSRYCALLAGRLGCDSARCEMIRLASMMHDVGKIGVPDRMLLKPGSLTPDEFNIMKQHAETGYRILHGSKAEILQLAATIARTHHEKYDGSGYPRGLAGDAIPLEGRIAAIADAFDALTSNRVYRSAFPLDSAISMMRDGRGKHFDPRLLDQFLASIDEALVIRTQYANRTSDVHPNPDAVPFVRGSLPNADAGLLVTG